MDSLWVVATIALVGFAPAIGSVWWLVRSKRSEQRQAEAMARMQAAPGTRVTQGMHAMPEFVPPPRQHVPALSMVPSRSHGRHPRVD